MTYLIQFRLQLCFFLLQLFRVTNSQGAMLTFMLGRFLSKYWIVEINGDGH